MKNRLYPHFPALLRLALGFLLSLWGFQARAQDVQIPNCFQTCTFTPGGGLPWSSGNQTFIFKPIDPAISLYIFIHNLNPTSAHTQTLTVWQTPFGHDKAPSLTKNSSSWTQDLITQNATPGASCSSVNAAVENSPGASGLGTCYVSTMFAAQVAIQISGATAQSGSPDNFEIAIVQKLGLPAGQQPGTGSSLFATGNVGTASPSSLMVASDANTTAWWMQNTSTNPASNFAQFVVTGNGGVKTVYFDKVVVECSVACTIQIGQTFGAPSGCGNTVTANNLKNQTVVVHDSTTQSLCTGAPSSNPIYVVDLQANTPVVLDLRAVIANVSFQGVVVQNVSSITGTLRSSIFWYEK